MGVVTKSFTPGVPGQRWPSGDYIDAAVVPVTESQLTAALGIVPLRDTEAGLGPWVAYGGTLNNDIVVELIKYEWSPPSGGFTVRVDKGADGLVALTVLLAMLHLPSSDLPWISPLIATQQGVEADRP